jgi:hypothetical protein
MTKFSTKELNMMIRAYQSNAEGLQFALSTKCYKELCANLGVKKTRRYKGHLVVCCKELKKGKAIAMKNMFIDIKTK